MLTDEPVYANLPDTDQPVYAVPRADPVYANTPENNQPVYAVPQADPVYAGVPYSDLVYQFENKNRLNISMKVYGITAVMARDYLHFVREHISVNQDGINFPDYQPRELINSFKTYGNINMSDVFLTDGSNRITGITSDITPIQVAIAKTLAADNQKLRKVLKLLNIEMNMLSPYWWPEPLPVKTDAEGNQIRRIGHLFWRETAGQVKPLNVQDLEDYLDQMAPEQAAPILERATSADTESLKRIPPDALNQSFSINMIQEERQKKWARFFVKLGADASIDYINRHSSWFAQWPANAFGPILKDYTPDQLTQLPSILLNNMSLKERQDFFIGLGYEKAIAYAKTHKLADALWWKEGNPFTELLIKPKAKDQLIRDFPVELLANTPPKDITLFFNLLGSEKAIQYANTHIDWVCGLESSPLGPLLDDYTPEQLEAFPSRLLRNMSDSDLCTFFKRLGTDKAHKYIYAGQDETWFYRLDKEVLYPVIANKEVEGISLKRDILMNIINSLQHEEEWTQHQNKMGLILLQFVRDAEPHNQYNKEMIEFLLEQKGINLWIKEGDGNTPLQVAVNKNDYGLVSLLLDKIGWENLGAHLDSSKMNRMLCSAIQNDIDSQRNNSAIVSRLLMVGIKDNGSALLLAISQRWSPLKNLLSLPLSWCPIGVESASERALFYDNMIAKAKLIPNVDPGILSDLETKKNNVKRELSWLKKLTTTLNWRDAYLSLSQKNKDPNVRPLREGSGGSLPSSGGVESWQRVEVTARHDGGETRFGGQLIIQLEDDPTVRAAAEHLAGKHPDSSVLVQLDAVGNYRVVYGDPTKLTGPLRWQRVGHGQEGTDGTHHETLGGYHPDALAEHLADFSESFGRQYDLNSDAQYVSLVGCLLTDQEGYAKRFGTSLGQEGIRADISVRRTQVGVAQGGQKLTEIAEGVWGHKIADNKLVFSWDPQGELVPADHLIVRLTRAISLVDALVAGKRSLFSLDGSEQATLADFFPQSNGQLDVKQVALTVFDETRYALWRQEAHQLLQLQGTYPQLNHLTGQQALQHSRDWNDRLAAGMVALSEVAIKHRGPEVTVQTQLAPHSLYMGNLALHPRAYAKVVGLAWLNARHSGDTEAQHFFNGLMRDALINEQKAEGALSTGDREHVKALQEAFYQLRSTDLGDQTIFTASPPRRLRRRQATICSKQIIIS